MKANLPRENLLHFKIQQWKNNGERVDLDYALLSLKFEALHDDILQWFVFRTHSCRQKLYIFREMESILFSKMEKWPNKDWGIKKFPNLKAYIYNVYWSIFKFNTFLEISIPIFYKTNSVFLHFWVHTFLHKQLSFWG